MRTRPNIVCGVGINDASYFVKRKENGKTVWVCPFYRVWHSMLCRCYREANLKRRPTYSGCTVCDEWLYFSEFKKWMEKQDWQNKQLDKDLLSPQSRVYGPSTCCFISAKVNSFARITNSARGKYPVGVYYHKASGKYMARLHCRGSDAEYLGLHNNPMKAHRCWQEAKMKQGINLAKKATKDSYEYIGLYRIINKIKRDMEEGKETIDFISNEEVKI